jgi:hypothetical protein
MPMRRVSNPWKTRWAKSRTRIVLDLSPNASWQWAEINQEAGTLQLEIYPKRSG